MKKEYLVCPQCNSHKFYVQNKNNKMVFFSVLDGGEIEIGEKYVEEAKDADFSLILCTGCSWEGRIGKLKKFR